MTHSGGLNLLCCCYWTSTTAGSPHLRTLKERKKTLWSEVVPEMTQKGYEVTWVVAEKNEKHETDTQIN